MTLATRTQTRGEETANSISHGIAFLGAIAATPILIAHAVRQDNTGFIVGSCIFSATMILLYLTSTLYHAMPAGDTKRTLKKVDHSMIFLLIAGTYTPYTLGVIEGAWGWSLFAVVWGIALVGVWLKIVNRMSHPVISSGLYILMGWLIVFAFKPLVEQTTKTGVMWLAAGGMAYTVGVIFYARSSRMKYAHFIWHLFVMTGTACHVLALCHHRG